MNMFGTKFSIGKCKTKIFQLQRVPHIPPNWVNFGPQTANTNYT